MRPQKFCQKCNNMLHLEENKEKKISVHACHNCGQQEDAEDKCVYRNEIHHAANERTTVLDDVTLNRTLPRTNSVRCAACGHGEVSLLPSPISRRSDRCLSFMCCNPNCGHRWKE